MISRQTGFSFCVQKGISSINFILMISHPFKNLEYFVLRVEDNIKLVVELGNILNICKI